MVVEVLPWGVDGDSRAFKGGEWHGLVEDWRGEAGGGRGFGPDVCRGGGGDCEFGRWRAPVAGHGSGGIGEFELRHDDSGGGGGADVR